MPLVSVIVPNYNHAPFLEQRLQTIFSQTFQDFEVIILDDCSTDHSREIINRYRNHPKVSKILYNEANSGSTFKQWAKGIGAAEGTYIWMAESDDWCESSFLETVLDGLLSSPACVVGYCQSYCIIHGNEIKWQSNHPFLKDFQNGKFFVEKYMLNGTAIFNASMGVWKKEIFNRISTEFTSYKLCGDWLFWIELCMHGDVFISGKALNYFRKHEKDVSGVSYQNGLNFTEEVRMVNNLYKRKIIGYNNYLIILKNKFLEYKSSPYKFSAEVKAAIENGFFASTSNKSMLTYFYYSWKIRHLFKTRITAVLSKSKVL